MHNLFDISGIDLAGFRIVRVTEVYSTNVDGRKCDTLAFLKNADVAQALAQTSSMKSKYAGVSVREVFVLVDPENNEGFVLNEQKITIADEASAIDMVRKDAFEKIHPALQKILGLR